MESNLYEERFSGPRTKASKQKKVNVDSTTQCSTGYGDYGIPVEEQIHCPKSPLSGVESSNPTIQDICCKEVCATDALHLKSAWKKEQNQISIGGSERIEVIVFEASSPT